MIGPRRMRATGPALVCMAALVACGTAGDGRPAQIDDEPPPIAATPPETVESEASPEVPATAVPAGWPQQLVLGVAPTSLNAAVRAFGPVGALVSDELGIRVTVRMLQDDRALLGELDAERVDLVLVDPGYLDDDGGWATATPVLQAVRGGQVAAPTAWVVTDPVWSCPQGIVEPEPVAPQQPVDVDARTADDTPDASAALDGAAGAAPDPPAVDDPATAAVPEAARDVGPRRCRDVPPAPEVPNTSGWAGSDLTRLAALPREVTVVHAAEGSSAHRMAAAQLSTARADGATDASAVRFAADVDEAVRQLGEVDAGVALVPASAVAHRASTGGPIVVAWGPRVPTEVVLVSDRLPSGLVRAVTDALHAVTTRPHGAEAWLDLAGVEGWVDLDEDWNALLPARAEHDDA